MNTTRRKQYPKREMWHERYPSTKPLGEPMESVSLLHISAIAISSRQDHFHPSRRFLVAFSPCFPHVSVSEGASRINRMSRAVQDTWFSGPLHADDGVGEYMLRNHTYASDGSNLHENWLCCVFPMFFLCFPHVSPMSLCYDFLTQSHLSESNGLSIDTLLTHNNTKRRINEKRY